jgi:hypothetical protein
VTFRRRNINKRRRKRFGHLPLNQPLVVEMEKDILPDHAHQILLLVGVDPNTIGGDESRLSDGLPDC